MLIISLWLLSFDSFKFYYQSCIGQPGQWLSDFGVSKRKSFYKIKVFFCSNLAQILLIN